MGIYFGGLDVGMSKEFLQHPNIHPIFQHMRGKAVAQRMATDFLVNLCRFGRPLNSLLQAGFKYVVPHFPARTGIHRTFLCWKHPLPTGRSAGIRVFSG
jgi:hypothetical protein